MNTIKKSWYKQFWPWFLILLPLTVVIAAISTVIIAVDNKPDMVVDHYYTVGKSINANLALLRAAKSLHINADVTEIGNNLYIKLHNADDKGAIKVSLHHATFEKRDISKMLTANADGIYHFDNTNPLYGKWKIIIEPFHKNWLLERKIHLPLHKFNIK